jgi:hypothetical protein
MNLIRMTLMMFLLLAVTSAHCNYNRDKLVGYIDTYFKALVDNNPSAVPLLSNDR